MSEVLERFNFDPPTWPGSPGGAMVKNPPASTGYARDRGLILGQEDLWGRKGQSTLVFLPRKFHGQRSPAGYSPRVATECSRTLALST